jgi:hypothetical protein
MTRRLAHRLPFVFLATLAFAFASCSGEEQLHPVTGSVRVDGKPANRAVVMFHPENPVSLNETAATAVTAEDGTFKLATGTKHGVKSGKYIVTVVWPDPNKPLTDAQKMMGVSPYDAPDLLGGRYSTKEKSSLRAEVKSGPNDLEPFDLKK